MCRHFVCLSVYLCPTFFFLFPITISSRSLTTPAPPITSKPCNNSLQVCFAKPKVAEETLSDWAADIAELLTLVERTTHLINKEQMLHKVAASGGNATA